MGTATAVVRTTTPIRVARCLRGTRSAHLMAVSVSFLRGRHPALSARLAATRGARLAADEQRSWRPDGEGSSQRAPVLRRPGRDLFPAGRRVSGREPVVRLAGVRGCPPRAFCWDRAAVELQLHSDPVRDHPRFRATGVRAAALGAGRRRARLVARVRGPACVSAGAIWLVLTGAAVIGVFGNQIAFVYAVRLV